VGDTARVEVLDGARTEADGAANAEGAKGDCAGGCAADGDDAHAHGDGARADGSLDAEGDGAPADSEGDGAADADADCATPTEHAEALVEDEGGAEWSFPSPVGSETSVFWRTAIEAISNW
jgi:hypothetical protein